MVRQSCSGIVTRSATPRARSFRGQGQKPIPVETDLSNAGRPETIGLTLDTQFNAQRSTPWKRARRQIVPDSAPGDDLLAVNEEASLSPSPISRGLCIAHSDSDELHVRVKHDGEERLATLKLDPGWRMRTDISPRVGAWSKRAMATGGLKLEPLPPVERDARGVPADALGLLVKMLGAQGPFGGRQTGRLQEGRYSSGGRWDRPGAHFREPIPWAPS